MSDSSEQITAEDIEARVAEDAQEGVESVSVDGFSVTQLDPMKRLDVADRLKRNRASANGLGNILGNSRRLISPGAWS